MIKSIRPLLTRAAAGAAALLLATAPSWAQQGRLTNSEINQKQQEIQEVAQKIGPWDQQIQFIEQATDNFFEQQSWNSPEDAWARQLMREVGQVPPWDPMKRQEMFLNGLQSRWDLSYDQRKSLDSEIQRESMVLMFKHFNDIAPVALEVMQTRAKGEPFNPAQVQQWAAKIKPMMDDGMQSVQRITGRLEQSMTPDQRRRLKADLKAFERRNHDMDRLMEKWKAGKWTPQDWGLQNDPIHAQEVARYAEQDANRSALVAAARAGNHPDEKVIAVRESEWDAYVKWFCNHYECDEMQRNQAQAMLKNAKDEAIRYRNAKRLEIDKYERLVAAAPSDQRKTYYQSELDRLQAPIGAIFNRLKTKLTSEVLTTQQQAEIPAEPSTVSQAPPPQKQ